MYSNTNQSKISIDSSYSISGWVYRMVDSKDQVFLSACSNTSEVLFSLGFNNSDISLYEKSIGQIALNKSMSYWGWTFISVNFNRNFLHVSDSYSTVDSVTLNNTVNVTEYGGGIITFGGVTMYNATHVWTSKWFDGFIHSMHFD